MVNRKTRTPGQLTIFNRKGNLPATVSGSAKEERKNNRYIYLVVAMVLAPALIYLGYRRYQQYRLHSEGKKAIAVITHVMLSGGGGSVSGDKCPGNVVFTFSDGVMKHTGCTDVSANYNAVITDNGMPLFPGDKFEMTYLPDNPETNDINFNAPTPETIEKYIERTAVKLSETEPADDAYSNNLYLCFAEEIYATFGIDGLANIFFYDEYWLENLSHNARTYKKMVKSAEYEQVKEKCSGR